MCIHGAMQARMAKRAFIIHEAKGRGHGHDIDDWLEAENQLFPKSPPGKVRK